MNKLTLATIALITLSSTNIPKEEWYHVKNENGKRIYINLNVKANTLEKDSIVKIYNPRLDELVAYTNLEKSKTNIVDEVKIIDKPFSESQSTQTYTRGDEGTTKFFEEADKMFRKGTEMIKSERDRIEESEIQKTRDIFYK
jgi:hypothetical protein